MAGKGDRKRKAHGSNGRRRANSTGTLERRGGGWLARWYVTTPQGDRVRMSQTLEAKTRADAEAELRRLTEGNALITREKVIRKRLDELDAVRAELRRVEDARPALAIADTWEAYRRSPERPQCGTATLAHYGACFARFERWASRARPDVSELRGVTRAMATAYLADLAANASPNTYNKHVALLRLVWRTVGAEARCVQNPWENVRRKTQPRTNGRRALTVEELRRVCLPLAGEMRLLFALGLYTGLRLGDCALLEWGSVDMARRVIVTVPRKTARTGRVVEIPLHPALAGMLAASAAAGRTGHVLPEIAELYRRDAGATLSVRIRAVFEAAGIRTQRTVDGYAKPVAIVGFHSLRHSFVSLMGNAGAPLALVQAIVGHANPMMTAHYFHARTDALAEAVSALPQVATMSQPEVAADTPLQSQIAVVAGVDGRCGTVTPAGIAPEAATSPAEREDAARGTERRADTETRLGAFYAAFRALSPEEQAEALRTLARRKGDML